MGGVFFFFFLCVGSPWRPGERRDAGQSSLWSVWGSSEATGISSPPMNPVDGRGFCPESPDWRRGRLQSHPLQRAIESLVLLQTWWGTVISRSEETTQPVRVSTILAEDLNSTPTLKLTTACNFRLQGHLTPSSTLTCTHPTTAYMHTIKNKIFKKLHVCTLAEDPRSILSTHIWQLQTASNSAPRRSGTSHLWEYLLTCVYTHIQAHTYTYNF